MSSYASAAEAVRDALRLARGMTYKSAAAGLPLGGGKAVIAIEPGVDRDSMLLDLADNVEALDGLYITAEDVGTHAVDMELIHTRTSHVVGLPREKGGVGDPSPATAAGVEAAMAACVGKRFGSEDFANRSVAIVGAGSVGERLARSLAEKGAKLIISDINEAKRALAERAPGALERPRERDHRRCRGAGSLRVRRRPRRRRTIPGLRCQIVCGSANNQLSREELAEDLQQRDIIYAPDFIANAGGIIHVAEEHALTRDPDRVDQRVNGIHDVITEILERSESAGRTPLVAAYEVAARRLEAGRKTSRA